MEAGAAEIVIAMTLVGKVSFSKGLAAEVSSAAKVGCWVWEVGE